MSIRSSVKKVIPAGLFPAIEPYGHLVEGVLFNALNGYPARGMQVIGVTGTNGKTTTCFLIHKMLHEAGYKVGLMTTVGYGVGDDIKPQMTHMTNSTLPVLMKRLKAMKAAGVEYLVLETTSQALAQNRVYGVPYSIAVFTNLTHEHLDWHGSFENYRTAKRKLFKLANANRRGLQTGIINADDPSAEYFAEDIAHPILYGRDTGEALAENVVLEPTGVRYDARVGGQSYHIQCNLPGNFNVYNSLAAVCVGRVLKLSPEQIERGITALSGVEGRMTRLDEGQAFTVIVDYAHTPDSFEKLFKDLRPVVRGKLIVMFGSAGHRDEEKRAIQGKLAGQYADEVVITEEDDRDVDGLAIMDEIAAGAVEAGKVRDQNLFLVHDRAQAIEYAVRRATDAGDTVLLLGKGHEKTIERANGENPWDEIGTARSALQRLRAQ